MIGKTSRSGPKLSEIVTRICEVTNTGAGQFVTAQS